MAKQPKQESPQPEPAAEDNSNLHPLLRGQSRVQGLIDRHKEREEAKEFKIAEVDQWKQCVNSLAASDHGRMFLRSMIQFSGANDPPSIGNPQKMVTNAIKSAFYLTWVRPFLQPDVRKELEP